MSNAPPFLTPWNETPPFSGRRRAAVRSAPAVRLLLTAGTDRPSSTLSACDPSSCATIETRTAAPSTVHSSSDHAMKMSPLSLIRWSVARPTPSRMEFVASSPARLAAPAAIWRRAISCQ